MAKPREGYHDMFAQIPEALWQSLNEDAERNQRTATGQLIWILRQQYKEERTTGQTNADDKPASVKPAKRTTRKRKGE